MSVTKADLFARKSKLLEVEIDDDLKLKVRKLTQAEVELCRREYSKPEKALEGYRFICSRVVVDDDGKRIFEDSDKQRLEELDYDIVQKVATECMEFSGVIKPEKDDPKP